MVSQIFASQNGGYDPAVTDRLDFGPSEPSCSQIWHGQTFS